MQVLDVVLGDAALRADLVDEPGDEPHHRVRDVAVLRVLESALRVETFRDAAGDAVVRDRRSRSNRLMILFLHTVCML